MHGGTYIKKKTEKPSVNKNNLRNTLLTKNVKWYLNKKKLMWVLLSLHSGFFGHDIMTSRVGSS